MASEGLKCMVCGGTVGASNEDVDRTVECKECRCIFVVRKRDGRLTLEYPDISGAEDLSTRESPG